MNQLTVGTGVPDGPRKQAIFCIFNDLIGTLRPIFCAFYMFFNWTVGDAGPYNGL